MTAEYLYTLVRDKKVTYEQIQQMDPKRFEDLEYTMKLIFNHDEDQKELLMLDEPEEAQEGNHRETNNGL